MKQCLIFELILYEPSYFILFKYFGTILSNEDAYRLYFFKLIS